MEISAWSPNREVMGEEHPRRFRALGARDSAGIAGGLWGSQPAAQRGRHGQTPTQPAGPGPRAVLAVLEGRAAP